MSTDNNRAIISALTAPLANSRMYSSATIQQSTARQWGKSYSLGSCFELVDYKFQVSKEFPFDIVSNPSMLDFSSFMGYGFFDRRIDAEKYILKSKIKYYNNQVKVSTKKSSNFHSRKKLKAGLNGDNIILKQSRIMLSILKKELSNIEMDHPEWLI